MWLLRIIVVVLLTVLLVIVALANVEPANPAVFSWKPGPVPLYLVIFAAAGFGFLIGLALVGIRELQWRLNLSKTRKEKTLLENEVRNLRAAPLDGLDDELGSRSSRS